MDLAFFTKNRAAAVRARRGPIPHPECPIEQSVRGRDDATRAQLARLVRVATCLRGATFYADDHGLRVLARCEVTLSQAIERLTRRFDGRLVLRPPAVRYVPGNPVLEPHMLVAVRGPEHYLPLVQKDMARRCGRIVRVAASGDATFRLEAEAPLAQLTGYTNWLSALTEEDMPQASAWLSRYLPIDDGAHALLEATALPEIGPSPRP